MVCIDNRNAARLSCAPAEVQARLFDALALSRSSGAQTPERVSINEVINMNVKVINMSVKEAHGSVKDGLAILLERVDAQKELDAVLREHPISAGGYGKEGRDISLDEFLASRLWLEENTAKTKTFPRRTPSSYGLKHLAEQESPLISYIPNGALIAAGISLGYAFERPTGRASLNVWFALRILNPDWSIEP